MYSGFFVEGVVLALALYALYADLWWIPPNSWALFLLLLGGFALGFLGTFCALLDFRGFGKKDVM